MLPPARRKGAGSILFARRAVRRREQEWRRLMKHELLSRARRWRKRRLILLASVAAIGTGVMLANPAYPPVTLNGSPAHAAVAVQPQAGFADLIDQVKPAVVS